MSTGCRRDRGGVAGVPAAGVREGPGGRRALHRRRGPGGVRARRQPLLGVRDPRCRPRHSDHGEGTWAWHAILVAQFSSLLISVPAAALKSEPDDVPADVYPGHRQRHPPGRRGDDAGDRAGADAPLLLQHVRRQPTVHRGRARRAQGAREGEAPGERLRRWLVPQGSPPRTPGEA